ncbi:hypothetical protein E3E35_04075 [Thermococcus sp. GR7]|uniref:hypothetical protein n=1 Tax=unclassified Thermococcus TaxID=2627626 RepID=UPI001431042E|nr:MULTISPECIES: hypothetical protein [unclassified Thermococcus]NJE46607.1 hypothetical protein [Thermococcus sp. GR7]NJE77965.1 hypothetical protein [Thermococcus sp. GR4]NJF23093.1 hypothetical protein [Thermococcus sp. GR5]
MPWMLVKSSYIGFKTYLAGALSHTEGDFEVEEVLGEISLQTAHLLRKSLGRSYFTLADAPLIPFEKLDEGDRRLILKALRGLRENERLKIERR